MAVPSFLSWLLRRTQRVTAAPASTPSALTLSSLRQPEARPWSHIFHELSEGGPDYRWAGPTHVCLCGNNTFATITVFHERQVGMYFTDVRCLMCNAYLIAPTEADDDDFRDGLLAHEA